MFYQRKSNWNTQLGQINFRELPCSSPMNRTEKAINAFNSSDMALLPRSILQMNSEELDMRQPFCPMSQQCIPRAIRRSSSFSDCSSLQMEPGLLQHHIPCSNSPSDSSDSSSTDLSDMMTSLSISQAEEMCSPLTKQELANLHALYTLTSRLPSQRSQCIPHFDYRQLTYNKNIDLLEKVANFYRNQAAAFFEAACVWEGVLPRHFPDNPTFSCKVFLGGVPWDVTEETLISVFSHFGKVRVEWPGKDQALNQPKGYVYIIFESEKQVKVLLNHCICDVSSCTSGNWYFRISSRKMKSKAVEVVPWCLSESNFVEIPSQKLDPHTTIFVGALHGMLNAEGLFTVMNELFGGVVYAGIDTDKFKYPIGSARVTFNNWQSYMKAVTAAFIEIKTSKFTKKNSSRPVLRGLALLSLYGPARSIFLQRIYMFSLLLPQLLELTASNGPPLQSQASHAYLQK